MLVQDLTIALDHFLSEKRPKGGDPPRRSKCPSKQSWTSATHKRPASAFNMTFLYYFLCFGMDMTSC
jgi:hypothetical protein